MGIAAAAKASYRKTKTDEWVAYGTVSAIQTGPLTVTKRDGSSKQENVARVGKSFVVDGVEMRYGYFGPAATVAARSTGTRRPSRNHRKSCDTDGNCSSFGTGRNCGGHDCDA